MSVHSKSHSKGEKQRTPLIWYTDHKDHLEEWTMEYKIFKSKVIIFETENCFSSTISCTVTEQKHFTLS